MKIFVVPYRNRPAQLRVFLSHMKYLLEDLEESEYRIYIVNQADSRPFNRGGMRNLGFLEAKKDFPETYKDIDFIFHDLDNLVGKKNVVEFTTQKGEINHIFGNYMCDNIGGIFVIKGEDYEKIDGYPNLWGWGYEDTIIGRRCLENGIKVIQKGFNWDSSEVVHLDYSNSIPATKKNLNSFNKQIWKQKMSNKQKINDGLHTLRGIDIDNVEKSISIRILHVKKFLCNISEKAYKPNLTWILSENFSEFLKKYVMRGDFKVWLR